MNDVLKTSGQQRRKLLRLGLAVGAMLPGWPARAEGVKTLRIGFQKGGGLLGMLKAEGKLEQLLAGQGWQLTWHEFPAGPQLLEALNAQGRTWISKVQLSHHGWALRACITSYHSQELDLDTLLGELALATAAVTGR